MSFDNMDRRGKTGIVSAKHVVTEEDLYKLLNEANGKDKVLVAEMGFYGLREGETIHFRRDWIHIDDSDARFLGGNHIEIPPTGVKCDCSDCWLRVYRKIRASEEPDKKKRNKKWKLEVQKKFYELKAQGTVQDIIRNKLDHTEKWKPKWRPKSLGGSIPTTDPVVQQIIVDYYNEHKKIGLTRIQIWTRIRNLGKRVLGREDLSPHYLRATFLTLIARKGGSVMTIQGAGRWSTPAPTKHYALPEARAMFKEIREITNKEI
jgi:integrase